MNERVTNTTVSEVESSLLSDEDVQNASPQHLIKLPPYTEFAMTAAASNSLAAIVHHYEEVALATNKREMKRFISEVRKRWAVPSEEEGYERHEGWSDEGAFNMCIFDLALGKKPQREGRLCEAETRGQILLSPKADEVVNLIEKPVANPLPAQAAKELLQVLQSRLLQQAAGHDIAAKVPPADFVELLSIANGIHSAGVPSETAFGALVHPLRAQIESLAHPEILRWVRYRVEGLRKVLLAGWRIGGCYNFRNIFYILSYEREGGSAATADWTIWDLNDAETDVFEDLGEYLQFATRSAEFPGGHAQECMILEGNRFPEKW